VYFLKQEYDQIKESNEKVAIIPATFEKRTRDWFRNLDLIKERNYLLRTMSEQLKSGTKHVKVYMLTPKTFFRALRNQSIDPTIYAEYLDYSTLPTQILAFKPLFFDS